MQVIAEKPRKCAYFTSLPRNYFVSEEVFEQEYERVISRLWLFVGHISRLRQPGDYFVRQVGPESMVITRDSDGNLRAFNNICRHRGARLCKDGASGRTSKFVCPYHQWTYQNDGALLAAPGARNGTDFEFDEFPLHQVHCQEFNGNVFINFSPDKHIAALADSIAISDAAALERVQPERTKVAFEKTYNVKANWKVVLENNLECYHCQVGHPEMQVSCNSSAWFHDQELIDQGKEWNVGDVGLFPFREGMQTFSLDGKWVCRRPLGVGFEERFSAGYGMPMGTFQTAYFSDYASCLQVYPVDKDNTTMIAQWLVHEDAVEGVDYDVQTLIRMFDINNSQDAALSENAQKGVSSRYFVPGPHVAVREIGVQQGMELYLKQMGLTGILPFVR